MSETAMMSATDQRRLDNLGAEIKAIHRQAVNQTIIAGIEIGRRLEEAKELAGHGNWGTWLSENVGYSQSQATNFMNLYREYGSGQIGLFGDTLPENIKTLGITKALALIAVPVEEREEFVEQVDAESISTRQLQEEIKRYKKRAEDAEQEAEDARSMQKAAEEEAYERDLQRGEADQKAAEYRAQVQELERQLKELEERPVEVAVEAPSEEMLAQIRAEEAEKANAERTKIEKKLAAAEQKLKDAEAKAADAEAKAKAEAVKTTKQAEAQRREAEEKAAQAEARAEAAEKKLKTADTDTAQLKIFMEAAQENWNKAMGVILKADGEKQEKFKAFAKIVLKQMEGRI